MLYLLIFTEKPTVIKELDILNHAANMSRTRNKKKNTSENQSKIEIKVEVNPLRVADQIGNDKQNIVSEVSHISSNDNLLAETQIKQKESSDGNDNKPNLSQVVNQIEKKQDSDVLPINVKAQSLNQVTNQTESDVFNHLKQGDTI